MPKPPPPRRRRAIPAFALYGEPVAVGAEVLHIEAIQSRSRLYHWEIDAHVHVGLHQIVWLQAGPGHVWLEAEPQDLRGPALVVVPPGVVHGFRFAPSSEGFVLTMSARSLVEGDGSAAGDALQSLFAAPRVLAVGDALAAQRTGALFGSLAAEFGLPDSAGSPALLWLARALVWRLRQLAQQHADGAARSVPAQQAFTRFVLLVEAHYLEHWPVSRYAARLGLTAERLNRLTRAHAGRSALELVHDRVAREACRRLVYVAAPVSRLAFELGFDDPAYFCRFFKRRTGASPSQYRQRQLAMAGLPGAA